MMQPETLTAIVTDFFTSVDSQIDYESTKT